jgi:hypothetical protein
MAVMQNQSGGTGFAPVRYDSAGFEELKNRMDART